MPRQFKKQLPPLNIETSVGNRISFIRKEKGLTQKELAESIGITQTLVSDYETGRLHLSDEMIIRFAKTLDTSADLLLGLDTDGIETPTASPKLLRRLKAIEELTPSDQKKVLQNLDLILQGIKNK